MEDAGTRDTTHAFLRSFSVVDELELSDSEFDELSPIPETPLSPSDANDVVDSADTAGLRGGLPFGSVFENAGPLAVVRDGIWLPGVSIVVHITGYTRQPAVKMLNPNLYVIKVEHGEFTWTIKRRYKHFRQLHEQLSLYRARYRLPLPSKEFQQRRRTFRKERVSVKFPMRPEPLITTERIPHRMKQLESYLQTLLKCKSYRNHHETRKFFEVSPVSFIKHLGGKHRESMVKKCSGGRRISIGCCGCLKKFHFAGHWNTRWLVLRDTFLAYIRPKDGVVSDVLLMDNEFSVTAGMRDTGAPHGLLVSNLSRQLLVKCWTRRKAREWQEAIEEATEASKAEFKQTRFKAFAPVRENSFTRWFVDGAAYFEAVAEALEKAREEIYITDWWLSPEIYLKRPITEGDRWRLDIILQRKAEEGVKIFILLYKEVEMALGIRSIYTKTSLMQRHPNIKVLRHPDHGAGGVLLWAHHEKLVVIDQSIAFLGGFDLCYGRWDDQHHRLTDLGSISYQQPQPARSHLSLTPEYSSNTNVTVARNRSRRRRLRTSARISDLPSDGDVLEEEFSSNPSAASPHQVTVMVSPPSPPKKMTEEAKYSVDKYQNAAYDPEESEEPGSIEAVVHTIVQADSSPALIRIPSQSEAPSKGGNPDQGENTHGENDDGRPDTLNEDCGSGKKLHDVGREDVEASTQQHGAGEVVAVGKGEEHVEDLVRPTVTVQLSTSPSDPTDPSDPADPSDPTDPSDQTPSPASPSDEMSPQDSPQAASVSNSSEPVSSSPAAPDDKGTPGTHGGRKHLWSGARKGKKLVLMMPKWRSADSRHVTDNSTVEPPVRPITAPVTSHTSVPSYSNDNDDTPSGTDEVDLGNPSDDHFDVVLRSHAPPTLSPGKRQSHTGSDSSASQTSQSDMLPQNTPSDGHTRSSRQKHSKERNNNDGSRVFADRPDPLTADAEERDANARRRWRKVFHVQKFESRIRQRQEPEKHIEGFVKLPATPSAASHMFFRKQLNGPFRDKRSSMEVVLENGSLKVPGAREVYRTTSELAIQEQGLQGSTKLWIGKDYVNFIHKDFVQLELPFEDFIDRQTQPRMPWHDVGVMVYGKAARDVARHFICRWNFTKIEKCKKNNSYPLLLPKTYTRCSVPQGIRQITFQARTQILRSLHAWSGGIGTTEKSIESAYVHCIDNAKHYIYIENQFFITHVGDSPSVSNKIGDALYRRILRAHRSEEKFRVFVVMPLLPAFEGEFGTTQGAALQAVTHWNFNSMCRGQYSLLENLAREVPDPMEYISFCGLRTNGELMGKLVTELVYVHSKLMIVDDKVAIIGSANINDRSMLGRRDSELAILVEDTHTFSDVLNGASVEVGYFACSLRRTLFREHLGLMDGGDTEVADIASDAFYKNIWLHTATTNTKIYDEVFRCIPCDSVFTFDEMRAYTAQPSLAETDYNGAKQQLAKVRGYLVLVPLHFLKKENLAPTGKESLLPDYLWT